MNRLAIRTLGIVAVLMGIGVLTIHSSAQDAELPAEPIAPVAPVVDPQAEPVLRAMIEHLKTLNSVKVVGSINMSMTMEGEARDMANTYQITIARPGKMAVRGEGGPNAGTLVADGAKVYYYMPVTGKYIVMDQPASFDEVLDDPLGAAMSNGVGGLAGTLWHTQAYERFMEGVTEVEYVGEETVDKQAMHHMKLVQVDGTHDIWITAGEKPTLARIVPDTSGGADEPGESVDMKVTIDYGNWQENPTLAEDEFAFTPPLDAQQADSFMERPPVELLEEEPASGEQISP